MSKKLLFFVLFVFLCGCAAPSTTFLGPTFTGVKTGSVYQTSLSYGSGKIVNSLKESYTNTIIETNKLSFKENEIYELHETENKTCYDPFDEIVVGYDGKIHLCCLDFHAELPLGNISDGFKKVLNNYKRKSIQSEFLTGKVDTCGSCSQFMQASQDQKNKVKISIDEAWKKIKPNAKIIFYENTWESNG